MFTNFLKSPYWSFVGVVVTLLSFTGIGVVGYQFVIKARDINAPFCLGNNCQNTPLTVGAVQIDNSEEVTNQSNFFVSLNSTTGSAKEDMYKDVFDKLRCRSVSDAGDYKWKCTTNWFGINNPTKYDQKNIKIELADKRTFLVPFLAAGDSKVIGLCIKGNKHPYCDIFGKYSIKNQKDKTPCFEYTYKWGETVAELEKIGILKCS